MGLGLTFGMSIGTEDGAAVLDRFLAALTDRLRATPLGPWADVRRNPDTTLAQVSVHPAGEPLLADLRESLVVVTANTTHVGPGYHAFLVDLLEDAARDLERDPSWDVDDGDETGYAKNRAPHLLQQAMLKYFLALAQSVSDAPERDTLAFSLPVEFLDGNPGQVLTPVGPLPRGHFIDALAAAANANIYARRYFAWWGIGFGADFQIGMIRSYAWMECRWTTPRNEEESVRLLRVLEIGQYAQRNPSLSYEVTDLLEDMEVLTGVDQILEWPLPGQVGYRRGLVRTIHWAPWSLRVPGCLTESTDDGQTIFWNHEMVVRVTDLRVTRPGPKSRSPATRVENDFKPDPSGDGHLRTATFASEGNPGRTLVVTIWVSEKELLARADEILDTVKIIE